MFLIFIILVVIVIFLYYLLVITEGTYLGSRVVIWLYDLTARRYDRIKDLQYVNEASYLGTPLMRELTGLDAPRLLDIATGTGRLLRIASQFLEGSPLLVGVDRSCGMLAEAQVVLAAWGCSTSLLRVEASQLAFCDEAFDCVCCLESLEFMWRPGLVLQEMVRVLKPGGLLLLSNRVGRDAWLFPGRLCGRGRLEAHLQEMGMHAVRTELWQVHYDLVWARKPRTSPVDERIVANVTGIS